MRTAYSTHATRSNAETWGLRNLASPWLLTLGAPLTGSLLYALTHVSLTSCMPLPLLAFVPVLAAIRIGGRPLLSIAAYATAFGAVMLVGAQHYGVEMYALGVGTVGGYHALPMLAYAWLAGRIRGELALALAFAATYTLIDHAFSYQHLAPIGRVAGTLAADPVWLQAAPHLGPFTLGFFLCFVNAAVAGALVALSRRRAASRDVTALVALALLVLGGGYLFGRVQLGRTSPPDGGSFSVAVVQGSVARPDYVRALAGDAELKADAIERYMGPTRELLARHDLVIWPESAWLSHADMVGPLEELFRGASGRILGAWPMHVRGANGSVRLLNALALFAGSPRPRALYGKNYLVPIAERQFEPFDEVRLIVTDVARLATPICFEAVLVHHVRALVGLGAEAIVVPSNDAGFGPSPITYYMLKQAILNGVAARKYVIRAAQSGVSAIVDERGRILQRTDLFTRETLSARIPRYSGTTFYVRHGDLSWLPSGVLVIGLLVLARSDARVGTAASKRRYLYVES